MALNIKNAEVEQLATEVARLAGESKTEAIRKALQERKARLTSEVVQDKRDRWLTFLEHEVWPTIPEEQLGRRLSKGEDEDMLGFDLA